MDYDDNNSSTFWVFVLFMLLCLGIFLGVTTLRFSSTGAGKHTGYITAIEQEGYIFQNYRVYVKTDNSSSQEDMYCMDRSKASLAAKLMQYSQKRELVSVYYDGVRGIGFGQCQDIQITNVVLDSK